MLAPPARVVDVLAFDDLGHDEQDQHPVKVGRSSLDRPARKSPLASTNANSRRQALRATLLRLVEPNANFSGQPRQAVFRSALPSGHRSHRRQPPSLPVPWPRQTPSRHGQRQDDQRFDVGASSADKQADISFFYWLEWLLSVVRFADTFKTRTRFQKPTGFLFRSPPRLPLTRLSRFSSFKGFRFYQPCPRAI